MPRCYAQRGLKAMEKPLTSGERPKYLSRGVSMGCVRRKGTSPPVCSPRNTFDTPPILSNGGAMLKEEWTDKPRIRTDIITVLFINNLKVIGRLFVKFYHAMQLGSMLRRVAAKDNEEE